MVLLWKTTETPQLQYVAWWYDVPVVQVVAFLQSNAWFDSGYMLWRQST